MKVNDEMLMAFVDGELDAATAEEVRRATERDAGLARRAEEFRTASQWSKEAFAGILREPAPERLVNAVLARPSNVLPLRRRWLPAQALPLAASIAILFGAAGYWLGQQQPPQDIALLGAGPVAQTLAQTLSGQSNAVTFGGGGMRLETLAAYKVDGGLCRTFSLSGGADTWRGVGCARGGGWAVEIAASVPADGFAPASSGATASIDAFLDAAGASEALSPEEEAVAARAAR